MGAVINWGDVVAKYATAGTTGDANTMDTSYILPAEDYIKGRLSLKYSDPLSSAGYVVRDLIIDEVYRRMLLTKSPKLSDSLKKDISSRLSDIINGVVLLYDSSGDAIEPDKYTTWSDTSDYTPTFGVGDILDMVVDPDQIEDEEDERD